MSSCENLTFVQVLNRNDPLKIMHRQIVIYFSSLYPVDKLYLRRKAIISGGILQRSRETWQCCRIVGSVSKQAPPPHTRSKLMWWKLFVPPTPWKKKAPGTDTDPHVLTSNALLFVWKTAALCCNASAVIAGQTPRRWHSESFPQTCTVTTRPHDSFFFFFQGRRMKC